MRKCEQSRQRTEKGWTKVALRQSNPHVEKVIGESVITRFHPSNKKKKKEEQGKRARDKKSGGRRFVGGRRNRGRGNRTVLPLFQAVKKGGKKKGVRSVCENEGHPESSYLKKSGRGGGEAKTETDIKRGRKEPQLSNRPPGGISCKKEGP